MGEQQPEERRRRVDVFCLTYGEPAEHEFRPQFEYSLSILNRLTRRVAPIPTFVTPLLAARRGLIRKRGFIEEGYHSPLEEITRKQVHGLQKRLDEMDSGTEYRVRQVLEFRPPYIWDHLDELRKDPPDDIVIVPLYVAESDFTSGVSKTDLARFHSRLGTQNELPAPRYILGWGFDERLAKVFADFVWRYCQENGWTEEKCRDAALILGAHGTLQFCPPGINSGARETRYFFGLIRKHLRPRFRTVRIGWLNHTLGGKWTFPEVGEAAQECWDQGVREVVYFPFGFMGDNAESQLEGKAALDEFEWSDLLYLPCVNDDPAFLDFLATAVTERMAGEEASWETIDEGSAWLIQRERPALPGKPGPLSLKGPALAALACLFWVLIGGLLTWRGLSLALDTYSSTALAVVGVVAVLLGVLKGATILRKMALKNLVRLRRIPQPSPIYKVFSIPTWLIIAFFASLGMAVRASTLPTGLIALVVLAVGIALLVGAAYYVRYFGEVTLEVPKRVPPPRPALQES